MDVACCICGVDESEPIAVGEDFEYRTSPDSFQAVRCQRCGLVYLDPRPAVSEFDRIYPASYHAFDFSEERFGLVYQVRRRLEARRLLSWCRGLPEDARILDVGCGDGGGLCAALLLVRLPGSFTGRDARHGPDCQQQQCAGDELQAHAAPERTRQARFCR